MNLRLIIGMDRLTRLLLPDDLLRSQSLDGHRCKSKRLNQILRSDSSHIRSADAHTNESGVTRFVIISSVEAPAGTIGNTISSFTTRKSMSTGRSLISHALSMTACASSGVV